MLELWLFIIPFNDNGLLGNIIWNPMLNLNNDNSVSIYNRPQTNLANLYASIFGKLQHISHFCLD